MSTGIKDSNAPNELERGEQNRPDKRCDDEHMLANEEKSIDQLSKRQLKKLQKKQRWEVVKLEKRAEERQKKKEKRRRAIEQGIALPVTRKRLKKNTMADSTCKQRVVIDCSFDDLMIEKDIFNLVRQLNHAYAANRRAENPVQFFVTSVEKQTKARLDSLQDSKYWDVNFTGDDYLTRFGKENVVYLSSDSENVLETLDEDKVYVIGGLVDHNHHKGLCLRLAEERSLAHAQLPITQYINMKTRKILTVNQVLQVWLWLLIAWNFLTELSFICIVFEILLYYTECRDWEKAFFRAIPQRKGAEMKEIADNTHNNGENAATNSENSDVKESADHTHSQGENAATDVENSGNKTDDGGDILGTEYDENNDDDCLGEIHSGCENSKEVGECSIELMQNHCETLRTEPESVIVGIENPSDNSGPDYKSDHVATDNNCPTLDRDSAGNADNRDENFTKDGDNCTGKKDTTEQCIENSKTERSSENIR